ncbi:hypothetical protein SAMN05216390_11566 [Lachnospiraceae bacterium KH1T2]|nr:hypothetical protein SAMN05216390_11566 [Lachnospiraceae bacterium KH1T2]
MNNDELERRIRKAIDEELKLSRLKAPSGVLSANPPKEKLMIIETGNKGFKDFKAGVQETLNEKFDCCRMSAEEALRKGVRDTMLLAELPFEVQARAALGTGGDDLSMLIQKAFRNGSDVCVLKDSLEPLESIASFGYRKLFTAYRRQLQEYGLRIIDPGQLVHKKTGKKVLVASDIEKLPKGSSIDVTSECVISYSAKEAIRERKINVIRR